MLAGSTGVGDTLTRCLLDILAGTVCVNKCGFEGWGGGELAIVLRQALGNAIESFESDCQFVIRNANTYLFEYAMVGSEA